MRKISIGKQSFASIRQKNNFYIDKTNFIKEWWEADDAVTLITRPRRFGKTLNMDMLNCFFSIRYEGRSDLFEGLSVWMQEEYRQLQGTYPVIFLSFASVKENTFNKTYQQICQILGRLYTENRFLLESSLLTEQEKKQFQSVGTQMSPVEAASALHNLSDYLYRYYEKKAIILLDEYDTPMQEAYINHYWDEMVHFIRVMFNAAFKTNPYLERGLMTGITRISKESVFSDLNNLEVVTTTSKKYENSFGFTEEEVLQALGYFGLSDKMQDVKKWYDGFTFGTQSDIYNPWSITNFIDKGELTSYWANTTSNSLVGTLLRQGNVEVKEILEDLLRGNSFELELDEQIIFNQLHKKKNAIWSLLLASGYLKVLEKKQHPESGRYHYTLTLTNHEVKIMMEDIIHEWFEDEGGHYNDFIKALLLGDIDAMNDFMNEIAMSSFSSFDVAGGVSEANNPERFYHGFVLGLMVDLSDRYQITSNRESGFGRYDIILKPRNQTWDAIIIEFKVHKPKKEATLTETVQTALNQIEEKRYDAELIAAGYTQEQIRHYGFAFRGKEVLIGD